MKKGQSPLTTGIVLCLATVYLIVYFSVKSMWNAGTVIAAVMLAALAGFQFLLHFKFFRDDSRAAVKAAVKNANRKQKKP